MLSVVVVGVEIIVVGIFVNVNDAKVLLFSDAETSTFLPFNWPSRFWFTLSFAFGIVSGDTLETFDPKP